LPIRVLPPHVASRIAAGEVIERPASIVKELIENSIDAGATRITIEVTAGGTGTLRVADDGCGIDPAELATAFERHATSKLDDSEDLSRILTLGFRGEALPSIASVAEVEAASRPPGSDALAVLRLAPEEEPWSGSRGGPVGTTITVRRLFERQPARRKFLRSTAGETGAIAAAVTHYALAYPEIRFALHVDGRETFKSPGSGDLRDAVASIYGADVAASMLPVHPGEGMVTITGLVGPPHVSRANRGYISLFVNRRWIQNRRLTYAVEEAYQGMMMVGRRPIAVLNIKLPYEEVDVNVHPTKAEVRFRDESAVFGALQKAVRLSLTASPIPSTSRYEAPELTMTPQPTTPLLWQRGINAEERASAGNPATAVAAPPAATPADALPALRVIGQFGAVYIIAEGPDGMYLIDQHAAHERVLYEQFVETRRRASPDVQGFLEPLTIELTPGQRVAQDREADALRAHGLDIEPFGEGTYLLRSAPRSICEGDLRENVGRLLERVLEENEADSRDPVAVSLACHGAVRAGKTLALDEMRDLVRQLEQCATPHTCPHGRPTMIHMSADVLAREFGRR
jgi:DNA mismatch repair protein MutL